MNNYTYGPGHVMLAQGGHDWLMPFWLGALLPVAAFFVLWVLVWKGLALWHAARRGQYWWFLALLIVNTFGILEIIYLFVVSKIKLADLFAVHAHHEGHTHTH